VEDNQVAVKPSADTNMVLLVHGWRMGQFDYQDFSDTMFKRLYWQGYDGRFASLRWPTLSADDYRNLPQVLAELESETTYNPSEFIAWRSGTGVSSYLTHLKQRFPNYNLNVASHSMGGIVMAEALKKQLAAGQTNVNNYVLMQAAIPASCYDTSFSNYPPLVAANESAPTPNTYQGYPGAVNEAVNGHLMDFFNTNDYALATGTFLTFAINWEANEETFKPDEYYRTDGSNCYSGFVEISDPREIMAFCARPLSKATGAQPNVGGVLLTSGQIDLKANYGFNLGSDQHSAQFNWNVQETSGFYRQLGISLGLFSPPTP
jgi:pimeloyl-ACP methyl ester carboxylesterase